MVLTAVSHSELLLAECDLLIHLGVASRKTVLLRMELGLNLVCLVRPVEAIRAWRAVIVGCLVVGGRGGLGLGRRLSEGLLVGNAIASEVGWFHYNI